MGLFSFFKNNNTTPVEKNDIETTKVEIPKDIFIDERDPADQFSPSENLNGETKGIVHIYSYLQTDYESRGYGDALVNPNESSRKDNIQLLKMGLQILMQEVRTNYEDRINELDFHIDSRGRSGLVDLVEELKSRKKIVSEHLEMIKQIKSDSENETGLYQHVVLSYQKGFMRGLSAITQSQVLDKKL